MTTRGRVQVARIRELAEDRARLLAHARQLLTGRVCEDEVWEDAHDVDRRAGRVTQKLCQLKRVEGPVGRVYGGDDVLVRVESEHGHPAPIVAAAGIASNPRRRSSSREGLKRRWPLGDLVVRHHFIARVDPGARRGVGGEESAGWFISSGYPERALMPRRHSVPYAGQQAHAVTGGSTRMEQFDRAMVGAGRAGAVLAKRELMPGAVIFDLDGVLMDSEQLWNEAKQALVRE